TSAAYGLFWLQDPVTVMWEIIFVAVNLVQLLIITYENRHAKFSEEEQAVVDAMVPGMDLRHARRVLKLGQWREADPGTVLITEGDIVPHLMLLVRGAVQVERSGRIVGVCGEGDFLGEISYLKGVGATATVMVANHVRYFAIEREELSTFLKKDPELRHAIEASFNRNLVGKLVKTSHAMTGEEAAE
ncbi:MAG: cyclic nucleotide-binding domain-containing protein, partial [Pseudomonadota bacterium]